MACVTDSGQVILFGGMNVLDFMEWEGEIYGDTWAYDPAAQRWTDLRPGGDLPSARSDGSMVYDPGTDRVILFGGTSDYAGFNDTWAYDPVGNTWTELEPDGDSPSARGGHCMVFDPVTGKIILFGGWDGMSGLDLNDTWAYDPAANTWDELNPVGSRPPARSYHSMAYDPTSGKVILFGGGTLEDDYADTWAYDPVANTWTKLDPAGGVPPARNSHSLVSDPESGKVILFGGWNIRRTFGDMWAYDPAINSWTELEPTGETPSPRDDHAMAYDPTTRRSILFGGCDDTLQFVNDTWAYDAASNTWIELGSDGGS
jgi:N-acetylneuraminic acid mutarotase